MDEKRLIKTRPLSELLFMGLMGQLRRSHERTEMQNPDTDSNTKKLLKEEILHLQEQLQDQFMMRCALEKALGSRSSIHEHDFSKIIPKHAEQLIAETAVLELEVAYLEKYLLALYRGKFNEQPSQLPMEDEKLKFINLSQPKIVPGIPEQRKRIQKEDSVSYSSHMLGLPGRSIGSPLKEEEKIWAPQNLSDDGIHRSHSSLSERSFCANSVARWGNPSATAVDSFRSLPLSMFERVPCTSSSAINLEDYLGTRTSDDVIETPNQLSVEMIKSMSAIYCELAEPPLMDCFYSPSSPISPSSSPDDLYSGIPHDTQAPRHRRFSSYNSHFDNPFHIDGSKQFGGPYSTMVKVQSISTDGERMKNIEYMLRKYRSVVLKLQRVNPSKLKHEEKLAFWINVHNALVMHAFLSHGVPQNKLKRMSLLLKAAYDIGGHSINVDAIRNCILQCKLNFPGKWLWLILPSRQKFNKIRGAPKAYAIDHPEPLLHFALCSGSHSDPAVRIFRPEKVYEELKVAKEEYLQANFGMSKQKIILPKLVENYAKCSGLSAADLLMILNHCTPDFHITSTKQFQKKSWKSFEWTPPSFNFQYLFSHELA